MNTTTEVVDIDTQIDIVYGTLPRSCRGVRRRLAQLDIQGFRGSDARCPIANYLRANLDVGSELNIYVGNWAVEIVTNNYRRSIIELSRGQKRFIRRFDRGAYPELVRRNGR